LIPGTSALSLRIVCGHPPADRQIAQLAEVVEEIVTTADSAACGVAGCGWLIWNSEGLRRVFRVGCEIERRLAASLPRLENVFLHTASFRWGIWIDQYIVPFDKQNNPIISDITAAAIFHFEPDKMALSSGAVYQTNRRWEHFVCAPRRLLNGQEQFGYRMTGHKRPSALDHAEAKELGAFVGRDRELSAIEDCWKPAGQTRKLAITAPAGSGKTRLIKEWLRRHPEVRALAGSFSLFGGAVENFASQLAALPSDRLDCAALVEAVIGRIHSEKIELLILDDLHWVEP
jgi:AAA ATPase domain